MRSLFVYTLSDRMTNGLQAVNAVPHKGQNTNVEYFSRNLINKVDSIKIIVLVVKLWSGLLWLRIGSKCEWLCGWQCVLNSVVTTNFSRRNLLSALPRAPHTAANCTAQCPLLFYFFQILRICGWDIAIGTVTRLSRFGFGRNNKFFSYGPSRIPTNTFCSFLCSPIRAICPVHLIHLDWITIATSGEKLAPCNFPLCSFLQPPVSSSHVGPKVVM